MALTKSISINAEIAGWFGAAAMVAGYALYSIGYIASEELWIYHTLNFLGALLLVVLTIYRKAWQASLVFFVLGAVSGYALGVMFYTAFIYPML